MKNMLRFLFALMLFTVNVSAQIVYNLYPNTNGNRIDLTIVNEALTTPVEEVEVKAIQYPQSITFKNIILTCEYIPPQGKKTVSFTFDVGCPSKIDDTSTDTLRFLISDRGGLTWEKSIVIMYALPDMFILEQNFPNPLNSSTTIYYQIPTESRVLLEIYNVLGEKVIMLVNEQKPSGYHKVHFDASNLPSGVYLYQLRAESYHAVKKLMVLK